MNPYTDISVAALGDALDGSDEAQQWLEKFGFRQLLAVYDAIQNSSDDAVEWLYNNRFPELVFFVQAITRLDKSAVQQLMEHGETKWAATANAALSDEEAEKWLRDNDLKGYAHLAEVLNINLRYGRNRGISSIVT